MMKLNKISVGLMKLQQIITKVELDKSIKKNWRLVGKIILLF